ncbi:MULTISPECIES: eCIS core domain-containing protein [Streptomyces]|uniref:eCIS core domain-containing protein n=1 Tax=Streptomyces TaxID=1883 RepID=UPI00345B773B
MAEHVHRAGRAEVAASPPQRPVMLSRPSGMYEQQARAAASPAAGGRPSLSRVGPTAAGPPGFTRSSGNAARTAIARVLVAPGQALEPATRKAMESHHGHDFSRVRVHTDAHADASARLIGAAAYTAGRHVVFAAGHYRPATPRGRALIAHELAHVIQQELSVRPDGPLYVQRSGRLGFLGDLFTQGPLEAFSRMFGEGEFKPEELQSYLGKLRRTGKPEGDYDSDNKARAVVALWAAGSPSVALDPQLKRLLVRDLYDGVVSRGDAQAILTILEGSLGPDLAVVLSASGVLPKALHKSFGRREQARLQHLLDERVKGGFAEAMKGRVVPADGGRAASHLNDETFRKEWEKALQEGVARLVQAKKEARGCAFPRPGELRFDTEHFMSSQTSEDQVRSHERIVPKTASPYAAVDLLFENLDKWTCECLFFTQLAQLYAWKKMLPEAAFNQRFAAFALGVGRGTPVKGLESDERGISDPGSLKQAPVGSVVVWFNRSEYAKGTAFEYEHAIKTSYGTKDEPEKYAAHPFEAESPGGETRWQLTADEIKRRLAEGNADFPSHFRLTTGEVDELAREGVAPSVITGLRSIVGVDRVSWVEYRKLPPVRQLAELTNPEALHQLGKVHTRARKQPDAGVAEKYIEREIELYRIEVPR